MRVMIVDDEQPCVDELVYLLEKYDDITIAGAYTNPVEALAAANSSMPDAVFVDIEMPRLSGTEFVKRLHSYNQTVQIVFVTAYAKRLAEAVNTWPFESLLKPVSEAKLDIIVNRLLRRLPPCLNSLIK